MQFFSFIFFLFVSLYLVVKKEKEECVQFFFFMKNLTKNNAQGSLVVSVIETVYHSFPKKKKFFLWGMCKIFISLRCIPQLFQVLFFSLLYLFFLPSLVRVCTYQNNLNSN